MADIDWNKVARRLEQASEEERQAEAEYALSDEYAHRSHIHRNNAHMLDILANALRYGMEK